MSSKVGMMGEPTWADGTKEGNGVGVDTKQGMKRDVIFIRWVHLNSIVSEKFIHERHSFKFRGVVYHHLCYGQGKSSLGHT